jgi:hypothetical protein
MRYTPHEAYTYEVHAYEIHVHEAHTHEVHAHEVHAHEVHAHEVHTYEAHAHEVHAHEGFYEDLARQNTVARLFQRQLGSASSHMGFGVVAYGFQSSSWCPKGQCLGRCTVCLGHQRSSALFRPVCLSPICPSCFCRSDWLANPIACASFPRLTLPLCR